VFVSKESFVHTSLAIVQRVRISQPSAALLKWLCLPLCMYPLFYSSTRYHRFYMCMHIHMYVYVCMYVCMYVGLTGCVLCIS